MITISPILALKDNYIWLITHEESRKAIIVDPGESFPVLSYFSAHNLELIAILITHHHADHTGGIEGILQHHQVPVYGPASEPIPHCTYPVDDNDQIAWPDLGIEFDVLAIPGHTHGHVAYYGENSIFCGDTLFTCGCGRIFEGTALQLYQSLTRLAALPETTAVYCGHEYTLANLNFAINVEPGNTDTQARLKAVTDLRRQNLPTVPEILETELKTNPFLRCHLPNVQEAVSRHFRIPVNNPLETFTALRRWKDTY